MKTLLVRMIENIDCMEGMKAFPENSIDIVITDPPYFLDKLETSWNSTDVRSNHASKTVGNLPKGMKFDRNQSKRFREYYTEFSKEVFRVLKPGGFFLSFSSARLYHAMATGVEEANFNIRDMLGWIYTQSQVKAFSQNHIINKSKGKTEEEKQKLIEKCEGWRTPQLKPAIEPICLAQKPPQGTFVENFDKYGTGLMYCGDVTKTGDGKFPSNIVTTDEMNEDMDRVFLVSKPNKKEKEGNDHITVKPLELIEHLIRLFSSENAVVLDPFMGSGTTAVAAVNTGRKYKGFEIDKGHYELALKRLERKS